MTMTGQRRGSIVADEVFKAGERVLTTRWCQGCSNHIAVGSFPHAKSRHCNSCARKRKAADARIAAERTQPASAGPLRRKAR